MKLIRQNEVISASIDILEKERKKLCLFLNNEKKSIKEQDLSTEAIDHLEDAILTLKDLMEE